MKTVKVYAGVNKQYTNGDWELIWSHQCDYKKPENYSNIEVLKNCKSGIDINIGQSHPYLSLSQANGALKLMSAPFTIVELQKPLFEMFLERKNVLDYINLEDGLYKEKNEAFFEEVADEDNEILYVDTGDVTFYNDWIVVIKDNIPNTMPVRIFADLVGADNPVIIYEAFDNCCKRSEYLKRFEYFYKVRGRECNDKYEIK